MSTRALPADWAPNAAALISARPELLGIGLTAAIEAVVSC